MSVELRLLPSCSKQAVMSARARRWAVSFSLVATLFGCGSQDDLVIGSIDFSVVRRDDFDGDSLDGDYWEVASHTFERNLAWFSQNNAKVEGGRLVLSITDIPAPANALPSETPKPYSAAEVRTRVPFLYGRFRTRARFASGDGIISSFWGFYDHYSMSSGSSLANQIVIESGVSNMSSAPMLHYAVTVPFEGLSQPSLLPFDPSEGFHELGFDWTPTEVTFFLDGKSELVVSGDAAAQLREYERLVLSAYPSDAGWLNAFEPDQLPVTAEFDWVEISEYKGPRPPAGP
jgi:hypothetical protein